MKKLLIGSMAILAALSLVGCDIESGRGEIEMRVKVGGEIMIDLMQILISVTISGVVSWILCYFMYK